MLKITEKSYKILKIGNIYTENQKSRLEALACMHAHFIKFNGEPGDKASIGAQNASTYIILYDIV